MPDVSEKDLQSALNLLSSGVTDPICDLAKFNRRMGARVFLKRYFFISRRDFVDHILYNNTTVITSSV